MRRLILIAVLLALIAPLGACGRKGELRPPPGSEDSDFPRQYPR
jgi:predicted small lipoprotein YifL